MPREVTDAEGITWSCLQAYAGLSEEPENQDAAKVKGASDLYWVVCTPDGGAKSVRIQLEGDWEKSCSDEELLEALQAEQESA